MEKKRLSIGLIGTVLGLSLIAFLLTGTFQASAPVAYPMPPWKEH